MIDHYYGRLEVKFAADDTAPGTFTGYGAVFGNVDLGGDMIVKGAFAKTIKTMTPKMLLQHGMGWGTEDEIPIGEWTSIEEDDTGLKVAGRLFALNTQKGQYIYEGMKAGVLDGLSIGYIARDVTYGSKDGEPRRTIKAADLPEISVVTFPMNPKARADGVKGAGGFSSIREFEAFLRDAGGFSHAQAKAIASSGFKSLTGLRDEADADEIAALTERFRALRA
jgi:HK97 family phage prohead protease